MSAINRRSYRQAMGHAKACLYVGRKVEGDDFSPLTKALYQMLRHQTAHPDLLQARLSRFTPNAKARLRLYPLIPKV